MKSKYILLASALLIFNMVIINDLEVRSTNYSQSENYLGKIQEIQSTESLNLAVNFTTYFGAHVNDQSYSTAIGGDGSIFVTGWTPSDGFPTTANAYNRTRSSSDKDIYVMRFSPDGSELIFSTFIGGTLGIYQSGSVSIALDSNDNVILGSYTSYADFPTTIGAYDRTYNGGDYDAVITKLSADGSELLFSTMIGGSGQDTVSIIRIDSSDRIYISGQTESSDFPTTLGAYNRTHGGHEDLFVACLSSDGSTLEFSTFLGGSSWETWPLMALDSAGNIYLGGSTCSNDYPVTPDALNTMPNGGLEYLVGDDLTGVEIFMSKLSTDGSDLLYSTYLGGTGADYINALAVDSADNVIITGHTGSSDFHVTANSYNPNFQGGFWVSDQGVNVVADIFVTKISADGSDILFSTYIGGSKNYELCRDMVLDENDAIYLTGVTRSSDFPVKPMYTLDKTPPVYYEDAFVSVLAADGSDLLYSSFFGGPGYDAAYGITLDDNDIIITGYTNGGLPTSNHTLVSEYGTVKSLFVTKFSNSTQDFTPESSTTTTSEPSTTTTEPKQASFIPLELIMFTIVSLAFYVKRRKIT